MPAPPNLGAFPLAYLLTWTCYGTRLHGDARGSVDRHHNAYGAPGVSPNQQRNDFLGTRLRSEPFVLDRARRHAVECAIRQTCELSSWTLIAMNVRTNHVHVVVNAARQPEQVLNSLKSWRSKRMIELSLSTPEERRWTRGGSTRCLWSQKSVFTARDYVLKQGDDLG